jgi:Domain of unknown function DUF29
MQATSLYDTDFIAWSTQQAALLKARKYDQVDWDNLIEEIQDLGKSQRQAIASYLTVLLTHLLKWQYQPSGRQYTQQGEPKGSWAGSIRYSRLELAQLLDENPSLKNYPQTCLDVSYRKALKIAAQETGLKDFPDQCPFAMAQILDEQWWPE